MPPTRPRLPVTLDGTDCGGWRWDSPGCTCTSRHASRIHTYYRARPSLANYADTPNTLNQPHCMVHSDTFNPARAIGPHGITMAVHRQMAAIAEHHRAPPRNMMISWQGHIYGYGMLHRRIKQEDHRDTQEDHGYGMPQSYRASQTGSPFR